MKTEASPRPWALNSDGIFDASEKCIGDVYMEEDVDEELLVRAVNSFDALVEATQEYLDVLCDMTEPDGSVDKSASRRATEIRQLLKLAKGEQ